MINFIRFVLLVLMAGSAFGQSSLPACQGNDVSRWTNCFGSFTSPNGNRYVGEVKDGTYNGQGILYIKNGEKHEGEFKDGKREGRGTYTTTWGQKWVGEYKNDQRSGLGTTVDPIRAVTSNQISAQSIVSVQPLAAVRRSQLPECSSAIFRHDCFDTQIFPNGAKYVGEFKSDKQNGQGIAYTPSGSIVSQGRWENNNLVQSFAVDAQRFPFNSSVTATQPPATDSGKAERDRLAVAAQSKLPECRIRDLKNCFGTETFTNGAKYVGEFRDGNRSGQGTLWGSSGNAIYSGRWVNDKPAP